MNDFIYEGRLEGMEIAFAFGVMTETVNMAVLRHDCDPVAAHVLGRSMAATLLLSSGLGEGERLNVRWQYHGELRSLLVDCGAGGDCRGLVSPTRLQNSAETPEALFGDSCQVSVVRSRDGQMLNSGTTQTFFLGPVKDLVYHWCTSEQVETAMKVMIGFDRMIERPVQLCQGLLLQALPGCNLDIFSKLRDRLETDPVMHLLSHPSESDSHVENILNALLGDDLAKPNIVIGRGPEPRFSCTCSRDKMAAVIRSVPINDRMEMVKEGKPIQIRCQFCNEAYELSIPECIRAWNFKPIDGDWAPEA